MEEAIRLKKDLEVLKEIKQHYKRKEQDGIHPKYAQAIDNIVHRLEVLEEAYIQEQSKSTDLYNEKLYLQKTIENKLLHARDKYKLLIRKYNIIKNDYVVEEKIIETSDIYHEIGLIYCKTMEAIERIDYKKMEE